MDGLRALAKVHRGTFRLTPNQNLIVANVAAEDRPAIEAILADHGFAETDRGSLLRLNSIACVALRTCALAMGESERYLPDLMTRIEEILEATGLLDEPITIRMTGCPNGCARPYIAEIGLVGRGPGRYNLYVGGAFDGSRLSKLYAADLDHAGIVAALDPLFAAYAGGRLPGGRFSAFVIRAGHVAATANGADFHANTGALAPHTPEAAA